MAMILKVTIFCLQGPKKGEEERTSQKEGATET